MKPTLQLRVSQQLTMTPQLQQAIRLLQLSSLELQNEIQEALDSNPLLEMASEGEASEGNDNDSIETARDVSTEDFNQDSGGHDDHEQSLNDQMQQTGPDETSSVSDDIPDELAVDTHWDDIYPTQNTSHSSGGSDSDFNFDDRNAAEETLTDHLMWQLNLTHMTELDQSIAAVIIESLDQNGYLQTSLEEIQETVLKSGPALPEGETLDIDEIQAVLKRVQRFDPPGIAARSLQECLQLQLEQTAIDLPYRDKALELVNNYLPLMGTRDYAQLQRKLHVSETALKSIIKTLQSLNPYPGANMQSGRTEYVIPDVIVTKKSGIWHVELNAEVSPKLKINSSYAALAKTSSASDASYIKNNLQEARWFIKSLISRNETLLKVANKIVEHQIAFFEYGEEAMKPLVLHEIAQAVEMHESTISRVTTQKYMHTPMGIFELKYFFSSHVSTSSGGECSSKAIQALIKKLVAAENKRKPLSDNQIAKLMVEKGINVARRTIAKYRESLNIPPSNERKQLI